MRLTDLQARTLALLAKPGAKIIKQAGRHLYSSVTVSDGENTYNLARSTLRCFHRYRLIQETQVDLVEPGTQRVRRYVHTISPRGVERVKDLAA